ncbi:unnamed protein product [Symbiodinium pilosum]|uniref:Uncharacterized protein n=1 Tax=Symbiodinium pilosum TaxID=2952 RepID=A0A812VLW8_SYMPI|nr:unnamed protein product [Symbiodinium pilosum]
MNAATEQPTKDAKDDVSAMLSDNKPDEPETKDERRKRLHRRNMRYYRSLSSPNCPKEIASLAAKCKGNSSQRSYLFENWLLCDGNWAKSSLLAKLKSRNRNSRRGLRKWMTRAEMQEKWGETITQCIIEAKESDEERAKSEIRNHPECPSNKVMIQYLCLHDDTEERLDEEELENVLEVSLGDSSEDSGSSSSPHDAKKKKKKAGTKKGKSPKKKPKAKGKAKAAQKKPKSTGEDAMCMPGASKYVYNCTC